MLAECRSSREKSETNSPSSCCSQEDQQNRLQPLEVSRRLCLILSNIFFYLLTPSSSISFFLFFFFLFLGNPGPSSQVQWLLWTCGGVSRSWVFLPLRSRAFLALSDVLLDFPITFFLRLLPYFSGSCNFLGA